MASSTFKPKGLTSLSGEDLVERLTTFNEAFDDCHKKQSNWIICNEILREKQWWSQEICSGQLNNKYNEIVK